uniref:ATP synthase complex subunit 8 n=1 Tax=Mucroberotha vesicaria TaxID=279473 RepID=A0A1S5QYU6_9NEOP|nr:ATP synthase F0 subunit 8 [Mucroberotha vesicaria]
MPQMSPLNWWFLFTNFIILLLTFNIMNYYILLYNAPSSKKILLKKNSLNWKW